MIGAIFALSIVFNSHAQGIFQNLNFELPVQPLIRDENAQVPTANAIPGWTAYFGSTPLPTIVYDSVSIGRASVSLQDAKYVYGPIQGNYSVLLQPSNFGVTSAAVGQIGEIPATALALRFYGSMSLIVTFGGQPLELVKIGSGPNYDQIAADISPFAGQTGELRFTAADLPVHNLMYLDAIRFSPVAVPEPSVYSLLAFGLFGLGWRAHHRHQI